jgi:hypothetical protein
MEMRYALSSSGFLSPYYDKHDFLNGASDHKAFDITEENRKKKSDKTSYIDSDFNSLSHEKCMQNFDLKT